MKELSPPLTGSYVNHNEREQFIGHQICTARSNIDRVDACTFTACRGNGKRGGAGAGFPGRGGGRAEVLRHVPTGRGGGVCHDGGVGQTGAVRASVLHILV
ncbi:uncharacterized protein LOC119340329 [Triticum dicoccoides]|uniref:uncharacterized protein LOC119340329 n=1 Tax=Triticum dicoccoides TaxID=85692 RepID=UPI001891ED1B|nr:uncharacterized protein LOC119340329 [Triticum dicoccoides]